LAILSLAVLRSFFDISRDILGWRGVIIRGVGKLAFSLICSGLVWSCLASDLLGFDIFEETRLWVSETVLVDDLNCSHATGELPLRVKQTSLKGYLRWHVNSPGYMQGHMEDAWVEYV